VELAQLLAARAFDRVATRAIEAYGDEIYGFLFHQVGNEADAVDIFGQLGEDLWKGLPTFAGRSSVRTWLYVLARHAISRFRRSPANRRAQHTGDARLDELIARQHTRTSPWLRSETKDKLAAVRDSLAPDDRMLLVLRVDRAMPWRDIALITIDVDEPDEKGIKRETDRLMKRFQLLKEQLRQRANELGIVEEDV